MPSFISGLSQIRSVPWGMSHLWNVRFDEPSPPPPFDWWFPASALTEPVYDLKTKLIEGGITSVEIPAGTGVGTIQLIFYDDENRTLQHWFSQWVGVEILGDEITVNNGYFGFKPRWAMPVGDAVRRLGMVKLNPQKGDVRNYSFLVFPKGPMTERGTAIPGATSFETTLVIAGR